MFLGLFLRAERRIFAYILTLLPHRADAEDVLQEVSLRMWEKFDEQDPPRDFAAWGCRIAYFRVLNRLRERRRQRVIFGEAMLKRVAETALEETTSLQLDERGEALVVCLGKLRRADRELLIERLRDGATTKSVAEGSGRSVASVYKALEKIRRVLLDCIERRLAGEARL